MLSNNTKAFFELVRAGLWEKEAQLSQYGSIDFNEILRLSEEQSVVGIVAAGLEHVTDLKVPKEIALQFVGQALQIEQRNTEMNNFIAMLTKRMQEDGIYALLIKGQGVAQCYERPYWRSSGDIDLLLDEDNYKKAKQLLLPLASSTELEAVTIMHFGMTIEKWSVELHGTLHSGLLPKMDSAVDQIQNEAILKRRNRPWSNNGIDVLLPNVDDDIIFVYTHIIKHFFHEGIGLRQICDSVRLLWKYIDEVNVGLLDIRIRSMGLETEWKTFGVIACNYLGFPIERFPFYSQSSFRSHRPFS